MVEYVWIYSYTAPAGTGVRQLEQWEIDEIPPNCRARTALNDASFDQIDDPRGTFTIGRRDDDSSDDESSSGLPTSELRRMNLKGAQKQKRESEEKTQAMFSLT